MSAHGHGGASEAHADHHYEYYGTPAEEPGPGEPATPGWVTLLGISLVLAGMLAFVATRPDGKTRAELTAPDASAAPPPATALTAANTAAPRPMPSGARPSMFPGALGSGAPRTRMPVQFAMPGSTAPSLPRRPPPPSAP